MRVSAIAAFSMILLAFSTGCGSTKKEIRTFSLGEKAEVGPFIYQASETQWPAALGDRNPKDRFLVVGVSVLNVGSSDTTIPTFAVVDDTGKEFPEQTDGSGLDKWVAQSGMGDANWLGLSRKVRVAQSDQGTILFDVPPKHYKLRVADEADNFVYIDMPFSLASEDPVNKNLTVIPK